MVRINEITDLVGEYIDSPNLALLQQAYVFSAAAHHGQTRRSGEPYMSHPLSVAYILAEMNLDEVSIAAGLLHDTVEDTSVSIKDILETFGPEIAHVVDGVTKISQISSDSQEQSKEESKETQQAETMRKMIMAMAEDIRVLMVKLADRLHNMRTLHYMVPAKQRRIARETLDLYAPLANRLGLYRVKVELEDLCLKYLKPEIFEQLVEGVKRHQTVGEEYTKRVITMIDNMMENNGIEGRTSGRIKHFMSIYNKMLEQGLELDQIHDLVAFRVIVDSLKDCYSILGLVHAEWRPVPGRFKDYISMPKANMYQSLHTTVIGPDAEMIEVQIRTEEMHQLAEYGVAAHWQYKEGKRGKVSVEDLQKFSWLREILDWEKETKDPREFMSSLKLDLFSDEVFVFTPAGDVKELPLGATPVDFAYLIHSEVGDHCSGAKVNGKLVPLSTELKNGDKISIITDPSRNPSRDWLKFVKTGKAISRIKQYVRTEERQRSIALGKEMLEKEGRRFGINFNKVLQSGGLDELIKEFSVHTVDDLLSNVGYSRITAKKVLNRLVPKKEEPKLDEQAQAQVEATKTAKAQEKVRIRGVDDMLVHYAKCCDPLPGDSIIGYVTRGRGVTVHTADCPNVRNFEAERVLHISWEGQENQAYSAKISIKSRNIKGALGRIADLLSIEDVNIDSGSFMSNADGTSDIVMTLEVRDSSHLYNVIHKLQKLEMILDVSRLTVT